MAKKKKIRAVKAWALVDPNWFDINPCRMFGTKEDAKRQYPLAASEGRIIEVTITPRKKGGR